MDAQGEVGPVTVIGYVRSEVKDPDDAPLQGDEADCQAWIQVRPDLLDGLDGIKVGDRLVVLTWLHLAGRDVLVVRPRNDPGRSLTGVFATRSPDRPNPIGLHVVSVLERTEDALWVAGLEAVDGTPVLDLKPVLGERSLR